MVFEAFDLLWKGLVVGAEGFGAALERFQTLCTCLDGLGEGLDAGGGLPDGDMAGLDGAELLRCGGLLAACLDLSC